MRAYSPKATDFLAPKYWLTWFGLGILRLCVFLPCRIQRKTGQALGRLVYKLMPKRRNIVETNIQLCFPHFSPEQQKQLVKRAFTATGMAVLEVAISWWADKKQIKQLHSVEGLEHLQTAIADNKRIILLASHFTTMELAGTFLGQHTDKLKVVYKYSHNPLFEYFLHHKRLNNCAGLLQHKNLRDIIRSIKQGDVVWFSPDQDFGEKDSVFAPFMGVSTCTLVSPQRLAKITGAVIIPVFAKYNDSQNRYVLTIDPPLDNFPTGNDVADATTINAAIEKQIQRAPEQYLWIHRRFKSRPDGEADVYTKN